MIVKISFFGPGDPITQPFFFCLFIALPNRRVLIQEEKERATYSVSTHASTQNNYN